MIHSAFNKIAGGSLQLIRRCDTFSCVGHCVCAPQDQKCPYDSSYCNSVTAGKQILYSHSSDCRDRMVVGFTTTYAISAYHY